MAKKTVILKLLLLALLVFHSLGKTRAQALSLETGHRPLAMTASEQASYSIYFPLIHKDSGEWRCYPSGKTICPPNRYLLSATMVSTSEGWAVGYDGVILHYTNGIWQPFSSPTDMTLNSVAMVSAAEGWVVGGSGTTCTIPTTPGSSPAVQPASICLR